MKVLIVNSNSQYDQMFLGRGWELTSRLDEADLVQFTGGSDVTPALYGSQKHPETMYDIHRDQEEFRLFEACVALDKPLAGICRGGQFLNVMCGGSMYQHVNNHGLFGTHPMVILSTGKIIDVTSTHHQMMIPHEDGAVLAVASESTSYEYMEGSKIRYVRPSRGKDVECVYYEAENALCFQPHPEYLDKDSACQQWYFDQLEEIL